MLWGECISGALYVEDFKRLAKEAGFADPRVLTQSPIQVTDPELADIVGNAQFYSITYRLFKLPDQLESLREDYGQYAVYKVGHVSALKKTSSDSLIVAFIAFDFQPMWLYLMMCDAHIECISGLC